MAYEELKGHGVTESTPKNLMLGAGTLHRGLKYDKQTKMWNFEESLFGATSGGNKLTITPEIKTVEVDGALVKVKGLDFKVGEVAKLETSLVEMTPELLKTTVIGQMGTSDVDGYDMIESKPDIEEGDYFENIAFIGKKTDVHTEYEFNQVQYSKDEYIKMIDDKNAQLESQVTDTQMALVEVYEMVL